MDKRFWAIIGIILIGFAGVIFVNNQNKDTTTVPATEHVQGPADSKVKLVEYGDYECPACSEFYDVVHEVQKNYASKIQFQFRNLPLTSIHQNAFVAARAAEAADLQGKFWEMHDLLYQNQDPTGKSGWVVSQDALNDYFVQYAEQLKLDIEKFKTDFASTTVNGRINADIAAFKETGEQQATPTFFLNGKKVDNSELLEQNSTGQAVPSYDKFSALLDKAIAENK